jgi:hypothetical protein
MPEGSSIFYNFYNLFNLDDWFLRTNEGLKIGGEPNQSGEITYDIPIYDNTYYNPHPNIVAYVKSLNVTENNSLLPNTEWFRREQALGYKMSFDMPCKCDGGCSDIAFSCSPPSTDAGYHAIYNNGKLVSSPTSFETSLPNQNMIRWFLPGRRIIKPQKPKQSDTKTIKIQQTN